MNTDSSLKYVVFVQLGMLLLYLFIKFVIYIIKEFIERKKVNKLLKQINEVVQKNNKGPVPKLSIKNFRGDVFKDGK